MNGLRAFLRDHRRIAALLVALALAMKALVPAGYMVAGQARVLSVEICADPSGERIRRDIVIPADAAGEPGNHGAGQGADHAKASGTCAFTALQVGSLAAVDTAVLALALAFILLLGLAPEALPPVARGYLRPPLRGPPLLH